jgi:hypothetical protein
VTLAGMFRINLPGWERGRVEGSVAVRRRLLISFLASIVAAVVLLIVERATNSKLLFLLQLPGFFAFASIWGIHSGPENHAVGYIVFGGANALVYWPIAFGLGFLFRRKGSSRAP